MRLRSFVLSSLIFSAILLSASLAAADNMSQPNNNLTIAAQTDTALILAANARHDIIGEWGQFHDGREIARKEIYMDGGILKIRYLWLDKRYTGGRYSSITPEGNGYYSFTETYPNGNVTRHRIKLLNRDTIQGAQAGGSGAVSDYVMTRK